MKITIDYESSWRNSFLDGSNDEPLPKQKNGGYYRKFIGSMTNLKKSENYIKREVTHNTVMGILNRLIGDQRKLYQSRQSDEYYFKDVEPLITFEDTPKIINQEMTYIRNITGSTDKNAFSGAIFSSHPMLISDYSRELWGVLYLSFEDVCSFILDEKGILFDEASLDPVDIAVRAEFIDKKFKTVECSAYLEKIIKYLHSKFSDIVKDKQPAPYREKNGEIKPIRLYAAALYLQHERLSSKYDMSSALTKAGKVAGFSKRGFNGTRDFMKNFTTGGEKKLWGNPYIHEESLNGVGKTKKLMTKASGQLVITLDIEKERAKELNQLIENAAVSSFYLGKKGLAYVSKVRV